MDNLPRRSSMQGHRLRSTLQRLLRTVIIKLILCLDDLIWVPEHHHRKRLGMLQQRLWVVPTKGRHRPSSRPTIDHLQPLPQIIARYLGNAVRVATWICTLRLGYNLHKPHCLKFNNLSNLHIIQKTMLGMAAILPKQLLLHSRNLNLHGRVIPRLIKRNKTCLL